MQRIALDFWEQTKVHNHALQRIGANLGQLPSDVEYPGRFTLINRGRAMTVVWQFIDGDASDGFNACAQSDEQTLSLQDINLIAGFSENKARDYH